MADNPADKPLLPVSQPFEFGYGFDLPAPPNVTQPLEVARATAAGLAGTINKNITNTAADAAVTADVLAGKIRDTIQQTLGKSAETLFSLHGPIEVALSGQIGQAMEGASRLGVVPPNPALPGYMPVIVQIREAALNGDLGPALAAYRQTAYPTAQYKGAEYAKAYQTIVDALPHDQNIRDAFATAVQSFESFPPHVALAINSGQCDPTPCLNAAVRKLSQELASIQRLYQTNPTLYAQLASQFNSQYQLDIQECENVCATGVSGGGSGGSGGTGGSGGGDNRRNIRLLSSDGSGVFSATGIQAPTSTQGSSGGTGVVSVESVGAGLSAGQPMQSSGVAAGQSGRVSPGTYPPGSVSILEGGVIPVSLPGPEQYGSVPPGALGQPPATPPMVTVEYPSQAPQQQPTRPGIPCPRPPCNATSQGQGCTDRSGTTWTANSIAGWLFQNPEYGMNPESAIAQWQLVTGIGAYYNQSGSPCDTGWSVVSVPTGDPSVTRQFCIHCILGSDQQTTTTTGQCCPAPVINITCPTGTTSTQQQQQQQSEQQNVEQQEQQNANINVQEIQGCKEFGPAPGVNLPNGVQSLSEVFGLRDANGQIRLPFTGVDAYTPWGIIANNAIGYFNTLADQLLKVVDQVLIGSGCAGGQQVALSAADVILGLFNKYIADGLHNYQVPIKQQKNYLCPVELPDPVQSAQAWYGNTIGDDTLECWVRAAGYRFPEFKKFIDANRMKFPLFQIGSLFLRGKLTQQELSDRVRELGMTNGTEADELIELLKVIPTPSDLIRFMTRDTDDAALVNRFGMDTDFQDKFGQQIQEWSKASGVSEEYMRHVWRAHWSIPSPGQLFEMLHRKVTVDANNPHEITLDDVKAALQQQDILPYWVDAFIEIAYRPLTRIDAKRAFAIGTLDREGLVKAFLDLGYNDDNAEVMAAFNEKQALIAFTKSPTIVKFASGLLSEAQFEEELKLQGARDDIVPTLREKALTLASSLTRKECIAALKKRYMTGDINRVDLQSELISMSIPADIAQNIVKAFDCAKSATGREIPAGQLAGLYSEGIISASDMTKRLQNIGYAYEDAVLLTRRTVAANQRRIDKAEAQAIREQEREQNRIERQQMQAANQAIRNANRQARALQNMQRVTRLREKRLLEAGKNYSTHAKESFSDAVVFVKSLYRTLIGQSFWLPDEIVGAIVTVSQVKTVTDNAAFASAVNAALQGESATTGVTG